MIDSNARVKAHRNRKRTGKTIPICTCGCGRQLKGKKSRSRGLASVCWKKSKQGKAETCDRVRQHRSNNEAYPNLFEQACAYEKDDYTWKQNESLRDLVKPDRKRKIIRDRAKAIVKIISSVVFGQAWNLGADSEDLYDSPSCGLFCGK